MSSANDAASASQASGVMERGGFYNRHSLPQHDAAAFGMDDLAAAAASVPLAAPGRVFVIADYGAAQGRNSLAPMRSTIEKLRSRAAAPMPIAVVHTDIPGNDFSALFELLDRSGESYLAGVENVFAYAAGRTFYRQLFPPEEVALGWSAIAVHWLSAAPMPIPGHIWSPRAKGDVRAAFAERARQDWEGFLRHRAVEMVPGGCLVVIGGASDDEGDSGADALMDLANEVLRDLVSEGTLAEAQYDAMTIPTYNRTPREFMAPFADGKPFNGLALERQALKVVPDALWESYRQSGNVDAFAASYVSFFRAAFGPSLFGAAGSPSGGSGAAGLEAQFADRLAKKIAAEPARAVTRWRVFAMLIRKAGG